MKTTFDLPEDVVREMKLRAVMEGRKLRDVAEEIFRRGLAQPGSSRPSTERHRVRLPLVPIAKGAKPFALTGQQIAEMEAEIESSQNT